MIGLCTHKTKFCMHMHHLNTEGATINDICKDIVNEKINTS